MSPKDPPATTTRAHPMDAWWMPAADPDDDPEGSPRDRTAEPPATRPRRSRVIADSGIADTSRGATGDPCRRMTTVRTASRAGREASDGDPRAETRLRLQHTGYRPDHRPGRPASSGHGAAGIRLRRARCDASGLPRPAFTVTVYRPISGRTGLLHDKPATEETRSNRLATSCCAVERGSA